MGNFISQEESGDFFTSPQKQMMLIKKSACADPIPTVKEILGETRQVTNWYSLGIQLEIEPEDLERIRGNYIGDTERCKTEVVNFWLRNAQECTWDRLSQAVDGVGGHTKLVQTLRKNHLSAPQAVRPLVHNTCKAMDTQDESSDGESTSQHSSYSNKETSKHKSGRTEGSSGYGSAPPSTVDSESEDASSSPAISVGCGCGKCTLYTLCTEGCLRPSGGTPLPIWNGTESTFPADSWQYSYESGLIRNTEKMTGKFANLVNRTVDSLKKVPLNRIILWVKHLEATKPVTKALPLLGERMEEVGKAENVEQLFWILSDYWSWYNNHLLKELITEFGDPEDQRRLKKYHDEFTAFLKQRLPKLQDHFRFGTGHRKGQKPLLIKIDETWEAIPLGQIRKLHHDIAEILGVPPHVLYLSSVSKGCICLEFLVPSFMPDHLFPLSASQEKALLAAKAFRLECGEYIWQAPNGSETLDSEANVSEEGLSFDKGYDGSSESDGQSDTDHPRHAGNKKKKRKAQGRRAIGSSKLHFTERRNLGHSRDHLLLSIAFGMLLATLICQLLLIANRSSFTKNCHTISAISTTPSGPLLNRKGSLSTLHVELLCLMRVWSSHTMPSLHWWFKNSHAMSANSTTLSSPLLNQTLQKGSLTTISTPHSDPCQYVVTTDFSNHGWPFTLVKLGLRAPSVVGLSRLPAEVTAHLSYTTPLQNRWDNRVIFHQNAFLVGRPHLLVSVRRQGIAMPYRLQSLVTAFVVTQDFHSYSCSLSSNTLDLVAQIEDDNVLSSTSERRHSCGIKNVHINFGAGCGKSLLIKVGEIWEKTVRLGHIRGLQNTTVTLEKISTAIFYEDVKEETIHYDVFSAMVSLLGQNEFQSSTGNTEVTTNVILVEAGKKCCRIDLFRCLSFTECDGIWETIIPFEQIRRFQSTTGNSEEILTANVIPVPPKCCRIDLFLYFTERDGIWETIMPLRQIGGHHHMTQSNCLIFETADLFGGPVNLFAGSNPVTHSYKYCYSKVVFIIS